MRANEALNSLGAVCVEEQTEVEVLLSVAGRVLPFHLFDIQAESSEGTMRYFVSAAGKNQESAQQDAIQQVLCDLDEADSRADAVIRNVEYLGTSEREFCNVVGPCEGAR